MAPVYRCFRGLRAAGRVVDVTNIDFAALHDAELTGVAIDRATKFIRLTFKLESGPSLSVEMMGVQAFRCEDLSLQNVVCRFLRSSRGEISEGGLSHWLAWTTSFSDSSSWLSQEGRADWLAAFASGGLELVVILPSAGAQLAVVCDAVVITEAGGARLAES